MTKEAKSSNRKCEAASPISSSQRTKSTCKVAGYQHGHQQHPQAELKPSAHGIDYWPNRPGPASDGDSGVVIPAPAFLAGARKPAGLSGPSLIQVAIAPFLVDTKLRPNREALQMASWEALEKGKSQQGGQRDPSQRSRKRGCKEELG